MATKTNKAIKISQKHLLGIQDLSINDINLILKESQSFIKLNQSKNKRLNVLTGKTQINLFFEPSTRTQSSFELAGKRLGADVMSMNMGNSAIKKGETLIDTAMTLNAMHPDIIVIRHQDSGACNLLSQKVNCAVLNAGDGRREHPTQALLDALTIIEKKEKIQGLKIAICGDILHSRVARSNIYLLTMLGAEVNIISPTNLMPEDIEPAQFLAQCEREGYPFCEELGINILDYLEQVLSSSGLSARVLEIEIGFDSAEVHRLSENPLARELSFTLPDSPFVQQKVSVITRIPQLVLQRLAELTGHGFPIKQTQ